MSCVRQRGFSLVETMVVAGLISTVVLFAMGMIPSFKLSNRRANMELAAGAVAQSSLEEVRSQPFNPFAPAPFAGPHSQTSVEPHGDLEFNKTVTQTPSATGISKRVRVELSWTWKNRTFTTFRETIVCRIPRP